MQKVSDADRENLKILCQMVKDWRREVVRVEVAQLSGEQAAAFRELDEYYREDYFNVK